MPGDIPHLGLQIVMISTVFFYFHVSIGLMSRGYLAGVKFL